jgi:hypothetical protein
MPRESMTLEPPVETDASPEALRVVEVKMNWVGKVLDATIRTRFRQPGEVSEVRQLAPSDR